MSELARILSKTKLLSAEEEQELFEQYLLDRNQKSFDKLILANMRFVVSIAADYFESNCDNEDLISEGTRGLIEALRKYEPRGGRFCSYAGDRIRNCIESYIRENNFIIRLGTTDSQRKLFFHMPRLVREYSLEEIAVEYEIPLQKVVELYLLMNERLSADEMISLPDRRSVKPWTNLDLQRLKSAMESVLTEREQRVIEGRMSDEPRTYSEIGLELDLTGTRVKQIETEAVEKLRAYFEEA